MIRVEQLPHPNVDLDRPVCRMPGERRTWGDLMAHAAGIASQLESERSDGRSACLLAAESGFLFLSALLGCWRGGVTPIVAPDVQPATLAFLGRDVQTVVTDLALAGLPAACRPLQARAETKPGPRVEIDPEATALVLYTSGSTGERQRVPKRFRQLTEELATLEEVFGSVLGQETVATVSHAHIYGLLFRMLWPLCRGDAFADRKVLHPEEILSAAAAGRVTLISSPSHLQHLAELEAGEVGALRGATVFSSGGPLPSEVALRLAERMGGAPWEVYGSTETGGVAWRRQEAGGDAEWVPMPGVAWEIRGERLAVRSRLLFEPEEWQETGDLARAEGGAGFRLMGRADRVAKVFEKRISLTEMERRLEEHEWIGEARVVLMPSAGREVPRLGAVAVLTSEGEGGLGVEGKARVVRRLRHHLSAQFETAAWPRFWRFVREMPRDGQGKVTMAGLTGLFGMRAERPRLEPEILSEEPMADGVAWELRVPPDLVVFPGHFPGFPVVPGVCELRWAVKAVESIAGAPFEVTEMEAVKFHEFLRPGDRCRLEVMRTGSGKWSFRLFSGRKMYSSGRLISGKDERGGESTKVGKHR